MIPTLTAIPERILILAHDIRVLDLDPLIGLLEEKSAEELMTREHIRATQGLSK